MVLSRLSLFLLIALLPLPLLAQQQVFRGRVLDSAGRAPLPFVNLMVEGTRNGTQTNLEGEFELRTTEARPQVRFSYVGYKTLVRRLEPGKTMQILLPHQQIQTQTLELVMGENPAHRIIKAAVANRKKNDPEVALGSFRYLSHSKMKMSADKNDIAQERARLEAKAATDTSRRIKRRLESIQEIDSVTSAQHFFFTETITERRFRQPNLTNEKVLATKVSGFPSLSFTTVATQFQPFTLYKDYIPFAGKQFLNPISPNSHKYYKFVLEDTIVNPTDSTFIISFRPRANTNFEGMKGTLYINTNQFALQNIIASNNDTTAIGFEIQQQYRFQEGQQWFPHQIRTRFTFKNIQLGDNVPAILEHKALIDSIRLNPEMKRRSFIEEELEVPTKAVQLDSLAWNRLRLDSLTLQDRTTYQFFDTLIGNKDKVQRIAKAIEYLGTGKFPLPKYKLDVDLNRLIRVNRYEAVRLGLGLHTSPLFSEWFSVGGYAAYGVRDGAFKYGGDMTMLLARRREVTLKLEASKDIAEPGMMTQVGRRNLLSNETFRSFLSNRFDRAEVYKAGITWRPIKFLQADVSVQHRWLKPQYYYVYQSPQDGRQYNSFALAEGVFSLRYAVGETFMRWQGIKLHTGNAYPVFRFTYTRGFTSPGLGQFNYNRYEFRADHDIRVRNVGITSLRLQSGLTEGNAPYQALFNGLGSGDRSWPVVIDNHFQTMGLYEFTVDRFVNVMFNHDFGNLLYKGKNFAPRPGFNARAGFGQLNASPFAHSLLQPLKDYRKGYYEAGVYVNDLFVIDTELYKTGLGIAAFYRMGPYHISERGSGNWITGNPDKNLFLKVVGTFSF